MLGYIFLNFYLCVYFGCAGSLLLRGLFSSCANEVYSLLVVHGLLIAVVFLSWSMGSRAREHQ